MGRLALFFLVIAVVSACSRPPELIGIEPPEASVASQPNVTQHKIFMFTTRSPSNEAGVFFSGDRSRELGLASVDVTVPPSHQVGQLERPKQLPPDPNTEFTIVNPAIYNSETAFVTSINRELASRPRSERNLLLFVHGYNNTTTDSVLRLAQFVEDSGFEGVPVLLSWASSARTTGYVYDLNSAFIARGALPEIGRIVGKTRATSMNIFAHSMGTILAMEGIVNATQTGRTTNVSRVDHIMLASPDIDIDLFRTQMEILPSAIKEKIYVLTSDDDSALRTSRRVAGGVPRVGLAAPEDLEEFGVVVIDLSDIENSGSGSHAKFTGSPEVVQLIGLGLNSTDQFGASAAPPIERVMANTPIRIFD